MATTLGGWKAACMFVLSLTGYVVQSQVAQYVQGDLQYRQAYFIFYLGHTSFIIIFPLHLTFLCFHSHVPPQAYLAGLKLAIHERLLAASPLPTSASSSLVFPTQRFIKTIAWLTLGISGPALLWYVAVTLTPLSDVTAILNTNAFWAYLLSVWMIGVPWQPKRLVSVLFAIFGVLLIVYGGGRPNESNPAPSSFGSRALVGDVVTFIAAIGYSIYQVFYKKYIALQNLPDGRGKYAHIDGEDKARLVSYLSLPSELPPSTTNLIASDGETAIDTPESGTNSFSTPLYPSFGLHPNFITSCLGLTTLLFLWPPIIILHLTGIELFRLPPDLKTWIGVVIIALCGVAYNAGFMVLLALWGPTLATVGNLLTIVLVLISDTLFGHALQTLSASSLLGAGAIVAAFGFLVYEEQKAQRSNSRYSRVRTVSNASNASDEEAMTTEGTSRPQKKRSSGDAGNVVSAAARAGRDGREVSPARAH